MKHMFRDNTPSPRATPSTLRKGGLLLGMSMAVSLCVTDVREKIGNILHLGSSGHHSSEAVKVFPKKTLSEAQDIAAEWEEATENQVLKAYRIKKGDTLSQIARKHGVTLESILKINKKITSANAIKIGNTILIPYDGTEATPPQVFKTTGSPLPLSFTQQSLLTIIQDVLVKPEGKLLGASGDQPSDAARLKMIAEKAGLGKDVPEVRYANLCAANIRAISTSLQQHLQESGIDINLGWKNGKNGISVGRHFSELSAKNQLPTGYQVVTTKDNPDPLKLKKILLEKGREYSIFVLSYSHDVDGHVNMAFRVGDDIIIFDPSWKGRSTGWPERFHRFEDYISHFVLGNKTAGYREQGNRYDLFNVTCVPAHRIDTKHSPAQAQGSQLEMADNDDTDMRSLTMVFEGFSPRMHVDTRGKDTVTYAIGYGTNVGSLQMNYPFSSYGKDVADYLKKQGHNVDSIKQIMQGEKDISRSAARDLFEMRYVARYQKLRAYCGKSWNTYPPVIRNMLVDMSYNMGEYGIFPRGNLPGFPDAVAALNRGDWIGYINAIVDSKYARDVGPRRVGKWIGMIVTDVLRGKTSGLSPEAHEILSTFTAKYKKDLNEQLARK